MLTQKPPLTLVVVPTNPFTAYEAKGLERLREYYNPAGLFARVYAVSPQETGTRETCGLTILGTPRRRFAARLREVGAHVVRAYGGYWAADLACRYRVPGIPVVVSVHDAPPILPHQSVRFADSVFCVSHIVAETVQQAGVMPERIRILPNRVDLDVFRPDVDQKAVDAVRRRFPAGRMILHVGRHAPQKNPDALLSALAALPPDYFCVFVGRGQTRDYQALAQRLGVGHRCHWIERVPNRELPAWYRAADCFCTPSRHEGFGIVFIEAAACGVPIITTNRAPMNEYLRHAVTAYLVDHPEDPAELARALRIICEDPAWRDRLSRSAPTAAAAFDARRIDTLEADLYREVLSRPVRVLTRREQAECWFGTEAALMRRDAVATFWNVMRRVKRAFLPH